MILILREKNCDSHFRKNHAALQHNLRQIKSDTENMNEVEFQSLFLTSEAPKDPLPWSTHFPCCHGIGQNDFFTIFIYLYHVTTQGCIMRRQTSVLLKAKTVLP